MPIPFRDNSEVEDLGLVGYLRFVDEGNGNGLRGALFLVNSRCEPVDFCFSRVDIPASFLWRPGEARRHAIRALCVALLNACPGEPKLLVADAGDVSPLLFTEDLEIHLPVARVSVDTSVLPIHSDTEVHELLGDAVHVFWTGEPLTPQSAARRLFDTLASGRNVIEPFSRAALGIEEAFKSP